MIQLLQSTPLIVAIVTLFSLVVGDELCHLTMSIVTRYEKPWIVIVVYNCSFYHCISAADTAHDVVDAVTITPDCSFYSCPIVLSKGR